MSAISPFLTGTKIQYAWDSTSLGYLKTCPRLYQYIMIEGWQGAGESIHLRFGQEYHQALQDYDISRAAGIPHDDAVHDSIHALIERCADFDPQPDSKAGKYKSRNALIRTAIWHMDHYREDPAKTYILEGGKPAVELSFQFALEWGPKAGVDRPLPGTQPFLLSGHLDRVVSFNSELFVMDYKTTTSTPSDYYFDQYSPNNQMSLYTLASQIVLGSTVKGVIIEAAQLMVGSSRFVRGFTYRTKDQLAEWMDDLRYWLTLAESFAMEEYWPMNDTACNNFGGCRFREICSKSPQVRENFLKSNFTQLAPEERWNPLKPR